MLQLAVPDKSHLPSYKEGLLKLAEIQPSKTQAVQEEIKEIDHSPEIFLLKMIGDDNEKNFFLVKEQEVLGIFTFRSKLDEALENFGGHVGFGISPQHRNNGYATQGLNLMKTIAAAQGLHELVLTCALDNQASEKVILKNGGIFEGVIQDKLNRGDNKKFRIKLEL